MRVLCVNMTLDPRTGGGSAARTLEASRLLAAAGVDCDIVAADEGLDAVQAPPGVRIVPVPVVGGRLRIPIGRFGLVRAAVIRAEVILLVNHWTAINALVWRQASALGRPYVVCPAGALPIEGGRSRWLKRLYNRATGRAIVSGASAHLAVTRDEAAQFAPYGVDPASVAVVPNVMPEVAPGDADRFRSMFRIPDAPILLFLGRLAPIKGPDLLVEAFARSAAARPDWHLVLGGPDDGLRGALEAQVHRANLQARVHFTGFLDHQAKGDALAAADLLVVPSRREAMSIVVLEAAAAGRPVLITEQCGVPEVAHVEGGWIVPATADGLGEGLRAATADRVRLADRGQRWSVEAARRFSREHVARLYLDVLRRVAQSTPGRGAREARWAV